MMALFTVTCWPLTGFARTNPSSSSSSGLCLSGSGRISSFRLPLRMTDGFAGRLSRFRVDVGVVVGCCHDHHCDTVSPGVNVIELFLLRHKRRGNNRLEGSSLETLSRQVLEFDGKARANPIGASFRCFLLG
jgi:hypothetical protein